MQQRKEAAGVRLLGGLLGALLPPPCPVLSLQLFIRQKIAGFVDFGHYYWDYLGICDLN